MQTLPLSPLPFDDREESRSHRLLRSDGFLDEKVVSGLIAHGLYERTYAQPEEMTLSSSEDDYAGWALPIPSPFRGICEPQPTAPTAPAPWRRPSPPEQTYLESGIETTYSGGHRWWLFGVSGAIASALLALTLLSLAKRAEVRETTSGNVFTIIKAEAPSLTTDEPVIPPSLTRSQPDFR